MKVKAVNNKLIEQMIADPLFTILPTGKILRKGKEVGYEQLTGEKGRQKLYRYVYYKGKQIKVHRIIYRKFIGELVQGKVIHHKDADGTNNHVDNLDQVTYKGNAQATWENY